MCVLGRRRRGGGCGYLFYLQPRYYLITLSDEDSGTRAGNSNSWLTSSHRVIVLMTVDVFVVVLYAKIYIGPCWPGDWSRALTDIHHFHELHFRRHDDTDGGGVVVTPFSATPEI